MAHYNTFIVRIWSKDDDDLHGQVTHVSSQEKFGFRDLQQILGFFTKYIKQGKGPVDRCDDSEISENSQ